MAARRSASSRAATVVMMTPKSAGFILAPRLLPIRAHHRDFCRRGDRISRDAERARGPALLFGIGGRLALMVAGQDRDAHRQAQDADPHQNATGLDIGLFDARRLAR